MNAIKFVVMLLTAVFVLSCGGSDDSQRVVGSSAQSTTMQSTAGRRMKLAAVTAGSGTSALDQTPTGFFYPIGKSVFSTGSGWWLSKDPDYFSGRYHIGVDMLAPIGSNAYAVADGKIYKRHCDDDSWGPGNCAIFVEHQTHDGQKFTGLYGHLKKESTAASGEVYAGKPIGKVGEWCCGPHLHFGIFFGTTPPSTISGVKGWGIMNVSQWPDTNAFIDPVDFIQTRYAYNPSSQKQTHCQGNICWEPVTSSCVNATSWYRMDSNLFAQPVGSEVCNELQATIDNLTSAPNPEERVPEDSLWRRWWRAIRNFFGETVSAADIRDFGTINTINVLTGNVVAGNATLAIHGAGQGYATEIADAAVVVPPDFVTKRTWLVTPWGTEVYKYGLGENFDTKAQFANIGDGSCPTKADEPTTIIVHFYLSRGYKEDVHSGDGAWRRLDSATIQCDNLKPGDTHTETKNTKISDWITTPGIYNVVACIDHPQDDHNNGGEHLEKHESNNCSTEAVFEVTANQIENVPNVDLTGSGFTVLQAPVYAGDFIRLGAYVKNQGTVNATTDIRSSYAVSCNGGPTSVLTDDGTMASTLTAGASAWEEILTPVQMPNVVGTCTLIFTVDYQGAQAETDETNNTQTLTVTLAPRPAPNLVITKFQDESGCCTTNTGSRIKPDIWVRNDGSVAPGANVIVVYHIASPIATGGAYMYIGSGVITPGELPPGKTDEDYMDNQWTIPKTSAWKNQWHTVRGCIKPDGSTPVGGGPGEICAYYTRFSKS